MSGELGDERLRIESVAYASADNARELADRLSTERASLESLARDLRTQTDDMSSAIPRQAALMVEAAKAAGEEVAKADVSLEQRLQNMETGTTELAEKLIRLDQLAQDAGKRTQQLTYAIARVEDKLDQSQKTVDQAVRAGEMAAAAAGTTGDALRDAVSVALDGARDASIAIQQRTREASEEAARALAALRAAGEEAANSIRSAGNAARTETDIAERRLAGVAADLGDVARRTPASSIPSYPNEIQRSETGMNGHANGHAAPAVQAEPPRIAVPLTTPAPLAPPQDDVLFEGQTILPTPEPAPQPTSVDANALRDHLRSEPSDAGVVSPMGQTARANGDAEWGDILRFRKTLKKAYVCFSSVSRNLVSNCQKHSARKINGRSLQLQRKVMKHAATQCAQQRARMLIGSAGVFAVIRNCVHWPIIFSPMKKILRFRIWRKQPRRIRMRALVCLPFCLLMLRSDNLGLSLGTRNYRVDM